MNGSVVDAARLSTEHIKIYLLALADTGQLDQAPMTTERARFETVDSSTAADADLFGPADSVKSAKELELIAAKGNIMPRNPLEARQDDFGCDVHFFGNTNPKQVQTSPPHRGSPLQRCASEDYERLFAAVVIEGRALSTKRLW